METGHCPRCEKTVSVRHRGYYCDPGTRRTATGEFVAMGWGGGWFQYLCAECGDVLAESRSLEWYGPKELEYAPEHPEEVCV